jgi:hypothetical protein
MDLDSNHQVTTTSLAASNWSFVGERNLFFRPVQCGRGSQGTPVMDLSADWARVPFAEGKMRRENDDRAGM